MKPIKIIFVPYLGFSGMILLLLMLISVLLLPFFGKLDENFTGSKFFVLIFILTLALYLCFDRYRDRFGSLTIDEKIYYKLLLRKLSIEIPFTWATKIYITGRFSMIDNTRFYLLLKYR